MSLDTFVDKIRINKFGGTLLVAGSLALLDSYLELRNPGFYNVSSVANILDIALVTTKAISSAILLTVTPSVISRQNWRYDSIFRKINFNGYNDDYCSKYMDHPCGRSIVKTVLKRTDNIHEYNKLKNNNPLNIKSFLA